MSIQWIEGDDALMVDAIRRAQDSFHVFATELERESRRLIPALRVAIVKGFFPHPTRSGAGEHMWVDQISIDDGAISGLLNDDAEFDPQLKSGSAVLLPFSHVSDWVLFFGARQKFVVPAARGGFTLGVLWGQMTEQDRIANLNHAPFCWFVETNSPFGST